MTSSLFLLLLLGASLTVHGRFMETYETTEDEVADALEFIDFFKPEEQTLIDEDDSDYEQEGEEVADFEAPVEETYVDTEVELVDDVAENNLGACPGGVCRYCFFKKYICMEAKFTGRGIVLSIRVKRSTLFSHTITGGSNKTFRISKKRFPKVVRRLAKSDLKIKLTKINLGKRSFCVHMSIKVRWIGNVRGGKCFEF